ncbi:alpha/beta hydrolase [Kangiella sp. HD9-110m-PIT-SAG07]|nr:alpha/beta hydrolase [Kangiella sp. HD9-110m-PIT-SAG07]
MARWLRFGAVFGAMLLSASSVNANSEQPAIPLQSHLIEVNGHQLHVHQKGKNQENPLLILLSGPTDNWHSDSAWWIVAQNFLAKNYQTMAIDRAGQAWSERIEQPSYRQFAEDLKVLLSKDGFVDSKQKLVVVAFASSNLSLNLLLTEHAITERMQGLILIDPDVLTAHSLQHYTAETEGYKKGWQGLEDYIRSGKYDKRISQKLETERQHLESMIPAKYRSQIDWDYYEAVEMIRQTREYQIHKFLEASVYKEDLEAAKQQPLPETLPLVVLDTDFESAYLEPLEDETVKASIALWRQEGIEWYFELAQSSKCGAYWPVETQEHLLMMTQPELIEQAIEKVLACSE